MLETGKEIRSQEAAQLSRMLSEGLCGLTVEQWKQANLQAIRSQWHSQIDLLQEIMDTIEDALTVEYEHKLYLSGALNIMNQPEFRSVEKVKGVLALLEEQRIMEELMLKSGDPQNISIRIGTENQYEDLAACSLVTRHLSAGRQGDRYRRRFRTYADGIFKDCRSFGIYEPPAERRPEGQVAAAENENGRMREN